MKKTPTTVDELRQYLLDTEAMDPGDNPIARAVSIMEALQAALWRQGNKLRKAGLSD